MPINSIYEGNEYKNNLISVVKINLIGYNLKWNLKGGDTFEHYKTNN